MRMGMESAENEGSVGAKTVFLLHLASPSYCSVPAFFLDLKTYPWSSLN